MTTQPAVSPYPMIHDQNGYWPHEGFCSRLRPGHDSTRSIVFKPRLSKLRFRQLEFTQHFPQSCWVEHEAEDLWNTTVETARQAIKSGRCDGRADCRYRHHQPARDDGRSGIAARESDSTRQSSGMTAAHRNTAQGCAPMVMRELGRRADRLLIDPYFSATKIACCWRMSTADAKRQRSDISPSHSRQLAHLQADGGNAATSLMSPMLHAPCSAISAPQNGMRICSSSSTSPVQCCRRILSNIDDFGTTEPNLFGSPIAIRGVAGDQQSRRYRQACFTRA